jgi:hypothetical protein
MSVRKTDYPPISITFDKFVEQMNNCLTTPFKNIEKLNQYYMLYKEAQYNITLNWILTHGYDTVEEWAEEFFKEWDFDAHSTILKSRFKSKYNNVKPVK